MLVTMHVVVAVVVGYGLRAIAPDKTGTLTTRSTTVRKIIPGPSGAFQRQLHWALRRYRLHPDAPR